MMRRALVLALCSAAVACATKSFDLGRTDPELLPNTEDAGIAKRIYGCVDWNDDEVAQKRGPACESACPSAEPPGERFVIRTQRDVVAITANRWMFCAGKNPFSESAPDAVGMEFAPGCRIYLLRRDAQQKLVRGTEATHQASFDIDIPSPNAAGESDHPRIDVHVDAARVLRYAIESAKCPANWLLLKGASPEDDIPLRPVRAADLVPPEL